MFELKQVWGRERREVGGGGGAAGGYRMVTLTLCVIDVVLVAM